MATERLTLTRVPEWMVSALRRLSADFATTGVSVSTMAVHLLAERLQQLGEESGSRAVKKDQLVSAVRAAAPVQRMPADVTPLVALPQRTPAHVVPLAALSYSSPPAVASAPAPAPARSLVDVCPDELGPQPEGFDPQKMMAYQSTLPRGKAGHDFMLAEGWRKNVFGGFCCPPPGQEHLYLKDDFDPDADADDLEDVS